MTEAAFNKKVQNTLVSWVERMVKKFKNDLKRYGENETRKLWREEYGLVFIKQYTVPARFRHYKKMPFVELPGDARRTLEAQRRLKEKVKRQHMPLVAANLH